MLSTSAYSRGVCVWLALWGWQALTRGPEKTQFFASGRLPAITFPQEQHRPQMTETLDKLRSPPQFTSNWPLGDFGLSLWTKSLTEKMPRPPQCRSVLRSFRIKLEHRSRVSDKKVRFNLHVCWIFDESDSWTWSRKMWLVLENRFNILSGKDVRFLCMGQILRGKLSCWSLTS